MIGLAAQAAVAIDNARLLPDQHEENRGTEGGRRRAAGAEPHAGTARGGTRASSSRPAWFELEESERRFRMLVEGVTDYAIFMLDPAGHVMNWNPGAERIKGYSREEIDRPAFLAILHR